MESSSIALFVSCSLRLCSRSSGFRDKSRPSCCKVKTLQTRPDYPAVELVAGRMAVNLITNVREALQGLSLTSMHCWLDSTVALYWIRGQESSSSSCRIVYRISSVIMESRGVISPPQSTQSISEVAEVF